MKSEQTGGSRARDALAVRIAAAQLAADRPFPIHKANGEEQRYASAHYAMSFTKGLEHDCGTGLIERAEDFEAFRSAIDNGFIDDFTTSVPSSPQKERAWEAPTAGLVHDLQGPDAQAVTMAPAPALGSDELAYEIAEVYELAALRDVHLTGFSKGGSSAVGNSVARLNKLAYDISGANGRRRTNEDGELTSQTAFRGASPGVEIGPYLSQFMLIGNSAFGLGGPRNGFVQYGAQSIDQRVPVAVPKDYMIEESDWLAVQNGKGFTPEDTLIDPSAGRRFICTPRDLATYVHVDQLYQAYLNACLILLSMGTPFDPSFSALSGQGKLFLNSLHTKHGTPKLERHPRAAGGFALYGGPHILSLVTEVATRALKAVRYQKFNNHIRLRPEALGGRLHFARAIESKFPCVGARFSKLCADINQSIEAAKSASGSSTNLLPMAFAEGSPMHPAYGAGHATVAGACVTILKAYFDTDAVFVERKPGDGGAFTRLDASSADAKPIHYTPSADGSCLDPHHGPCLTLEGELNKLAANISIGRNMGGVHYFSDYYDSVRMGEEIAIGMLEEQALCYPTDPFVLSVPTFDGEVRRIGAR